MEEWVIGTLVGILEPQQGSIATLSPDPRPYEIRTQRNPYELESKLLVSPVRTPIVVPCILNPLSRNLDYKSYQRPQQAGHPLASLCLST